MTEPKRICKTCAWWECTDPLGDAEGWENAILGGDCHYEISGYSRNSDWWCRHWSKTTGWIDEDENIEGQGNEKNRLR